MASVTSLLYHIADKGLLSLNLDSLTCWAINFEYAASRNEAAWPWRNGFGHYWGTGFDTHQVSRTFSVAELILAFLNRDGRTYITGDTYIRT